MRFTIRRGCFETNSSSVHSIQVMNTVRQKSKLKVFSDGKVHVPCGEFGKEHCVYTDQMTKLSYLVTQLVYSTKAYYDGDPDELYHDYEFELLDGYIREYCGCNGIKVIKLNKADIDHQSQPESGYVEFINLYDKDKVLDFIFCEDFALVTDCD
jgi:uncharacterized protein YutD